MSSQYSKRHSEEFKRDAIALARSSFYAWLEAEEARQARTRADDALAHEITVIHLASKGVYGVPRVHAELAAQGREVAEPGSGLERQRPAAELQRGQSEGLAQQVQAPAADLVGRLGGGREAAVHPPVPQRPGLREPHVGAQRLFFQEPPQAAPGRHRQRAPGQRPLQLPAHHGQLTPPRRAGAQSVEELVERAHRRERRRLHAAIVAHRPGRAEDGRGSGPLLRARTGKTAAVVGGSGAVMTGTAREAVNSDAGTTAAAGSGRRVARVSARVPTRRLRPAGAAGDAALTGQAVTKS
ncbi:IS3 family transposase [Streptomyces hygroscopicus]|uniref:IS3 family transposase n=1 Tax=Streptomyces hygroscopicus TaxID=1912 RepID=UPI00362DCBF3